MKKLFGRKDDRYKFVTPKPTKDTCPYCVFRFEKAPTRKKKCPECGKYIFVRFGKLYTEDEKDINDWLDRNTIKELGINRIAFNKTREKLRKEFGFVASVNDTAWRILNRINTTKMSFHDRRLIYLSMERILKAEGKNTDEVSAKAHEMELLEGKAENEASANKFRKDFLEMQKMGSDMVVRINTCNDEYVCDECKRLAK